MLQGIRALDLTSYIAGPTCPRTLADLGADVIKVEEPSDEPPLWYPNLHVETHRGKRHLVLDVKQPRGREVFLKLVATADVVIENSKAGVWDRQGLGYRDLLAVQPHLVYASVKAYGEEGPWGEWGGFEPNAQAVTGLQVRFGGREGPPRQAGGGAINDYHAPQLAAYAILLALRANQESPRARKVTSALAWSATLFQSADLLEMPGYRVEPIGGATLRGPSPTSRLWPASDGWIYAVLPGDATQRFVHALDQEAGDLDFFDIESANHLERVTRTHSTDDLLALVAAQGGYATSAPTGDQLKERLSEGGLYRFSNQPAWGVVGSLGATVETAPPLIDAHRPAPAWGEHTHAILSELGYSAEEIDVLHTDGIVMGGVVAAKAAV